MLVDAPKLAIVHYPNPVLRQKARRIQNVDDNVRAVARRMLELMHEAPGVGLAAPQVGLPWRMFVACATGDAKDDMVFINPALSMPSKEMADADEGCLSLPEINGQIRRHHAITITALDIEGKTFTLTGEDLPARIWQHEYDHLDGVLIIDKMPPIDRMANRKKIRELEKGG